MKNPLKTLYFDPSLVSLLRDQPALILKLAQQNRKFLQVVAHPDKKGAASTEYSAELNQAVDLLQDPEQRKVWIDEYLQEISNVDQMKRELAVQRNIGKNLLQMAKEFEGKQNELREKINKLEAEINSLEKKGQEQMMSWLIYRKPFTKVLVPDTRLFLPEIQNMIIEIGDENSLNLYFMFDWQTIRIMEGKRNQVEKQLANMQTLFREKGALPGRKLPLQQIAGCIGTEPMSEGKMPIRQAYREIMDISPFLEVGKNLVSCSLEKKKRGEEEILVSFMRRGKITDLREFSLD